jgi:hypothetical protein
MTEKTTDVDTRSANVIPKSGIRPNYTEKHILWWTVKEAADFCYVKPGTIRKWSALGYFNTRRIPRKTCVDRESLERFLSAQRER